MYFSDVFNKNIAKTDFIKNMLLYLIFLVRKTIFLYPLFFDFDISFIFKYRKLIKSRGII